ncbi:MAG: hypothetical protein GY898_26250 [Proteobacteria bacterium]|nr:hypothetical protein [Pseudomonadota bacterium]
MRAALTWALLGLLLAGCPTADDDDATGPPDDDDTVDDDDSNDDDDSVDDDDSGDDDDDDSAVGDDDDTTPPRWICSEDSEGPNGTFETAVEGPPFGVSRDQLTLCNVGDSDWFWWDLNAEDVITIDADYEQPAGNIALELYDADGQLLTMSDDLEDDERVWWQVFEDTRVYARIHLQDDPIGVPGMFYGLGQLRCFADEYEENDSLAQAAPNQVPFSILDLSTCLPDEEDWWVLEGVLPGDVMQVRSVFSTIDGDLDFELFAPTGELLESGNNIGPLETIVYWAETGGDYVLRTWVAADYRGPGMHYDLDVDIAGSPGECYPDPVEPNDSEGEATSLTITLYEDFSACEGDDDYYAIEAGVGDVLVIDLDFTHNEGDIDAFLIDPLGSEVAASDSSTDDEQLVVPVYLAGTYTLQVTLTDDLGGIPGNFYNMGISGPLTYPCVADSLEPNDSLETAQPMPNGDYRDQTICPGEDDWYELSLNRLEFVELNLGTNHFFEGNADAYLRDATGAVVASTTAPFGNEFFTYSVPETALYYLQVTLESDEGTIAGTIYDFAVLSLIMSTCSPDIWEPNDSYGAAAPINTGPTNGATVCEGEPDFFSFTATAGDDIQIEATFDGAEGNIEGFLYDPSGTQVAGPSTTFNHNAGSSGTWTVEFSLPSDSGSMTGNSYDFTLSL